MCLVLFACGCPNGVTWTQPATAATTLRLSVTPNRALARGETVELTVTATLSGSLGLQPESSVGFAIPLELIGSDPASISMAVAPGGSASHTATIVVPDDGIYRTIKAFAYGVTSNGGLLTASQVIEVNTAGTPRAESGSSGVWTVPVRVSLTAAQRLRRNSDVDLTLSAVVEADYPVFQLGLNLPATVTLSSGATTTPSGAVTAGAAPQLQARIHVPDVDTPLPIAGFALFGASDPPVGDVSVRLLTTP
jgi:hypothetical protein